MKSIRRNLGLFSVGCRVENPADPKKSAVIPSVLVDTGSEFTCIDEKILYQVGIDPRKKDLQIQMATGQIITRSVGYAILHVDRSETTDEVVFAQKGDLLLLGWRALEALNLRVDSRHTKLVAARPIIAAASSSYWRSNAARVTPTFLSASWEAFLRGEPRGRETSQLAGSKAGATSNENLNLRRTEHHG